ncbi:MAG: hypothetical protein IKG88_05455, partial [Bacteroidales bacterium]|nr:hypothetical protein [Bacteroidales bacterium]
KPIRITVSTPSTRPVCSHPASRSAIAPPLSADNFTLLSICLYAFTRLPSTHTPYSISLQPISYPYTFKLRTPSTTIPRHQMNYLITVVKESLRRA